MNNFIKNYILVFFFIFEWIIYALLMIETKFSFYVAELKMMPGMHLGEHGFEDATESIQQQNQMTSLQNRMEFGAFCVAVLVTFICSKIWPTNTAS